MPLATTQRQRLTKKSADILWSRRNATAMQSKSAANYYSILKCLRTSYSGPAVRSPYRLERTSDLSTTHGYYKPDVNVHDSETCRLRAVEWPCLSDDENSQIPSQALESNPS